jgi:hypothetical protein
MNKLIILLNLLFALNCMAQTYQELQDIFYFTSKKLDAARDSISALKRLDSVIQIQKKQLQKDSMIIANESVLNSNYQKQINILSEELYKKDEKPSFEFRGFYMGLSSFYCLDSNIIKYSVWENMKYNVTGTFKFNILDRIDFSCGIEIPLRKEKFFINTNLDWRIFK